MTVNHLYPNVFVIGAAKSGTSSITEYLNTRPEIFVPRIKEPNYFSTDIDVKLFRQDYRATVFNKQTSNHIKKGNVHLAFVRKYDDYINLYSNALSGSFPYSTDCSTSYLFSKEAPGNIYRYNSNSKIIVCLRNPYERAISHYSMDISQGKQKHKSLYEALEEELLINDRVWGREFLYIDLGLYSDQLERYFSIFSQDQILVLFYQDLKNNPQYFFDQINLFLEIKSSSTMDSANTFHANKTLVPKNKFIRIGKNISGYIPGVIVDWVKKKFESLLFNQALISPNDNKAMELMSIYFQPELERLKQLFEKYTIPGAKKLDQLFAIKYI